MLLNITSKLRRLNSRKNNYGYDINRNIGFYKRWYEKAFDTVKDSSIGWIMSILGAVIIANYCIPCTKIVSYFLAVEKVPIAIKSFHRGRQPHY
jgi:hypothetical protein